MLGAIFDTFFEYFPVILIGFGLLLIILNAGSGGGKSSGKK